VLVSESETESASTFLLVRQLPVPIELAGTFIPADGYARLQQRETIGLVCKTRYSHSCGWLDGREVRKDIPDPAPSSAEAMAWHIEATRRNWIGDHPRNRNDREARYPDHGVMACRIATAMSRRPMRVVAEALRLPWPRFTGAGRAIGSLTSGC